MKITDRTKELVNLKNVQITALRAAANGIVITDRDGYIIWVNPAMTDLTGFTSEELYNKRTSIFRSNRHSNSFYRDLWETIASGNVWRGDIINKKKDGSLYHEDMTITPVLDDDRNITHYIAVKQDITAYRQAIENLQQSEERFRLLIESVNAHFYVTEYTKEHGFRNRFISGNLEKLTGYPTQNFLDDWTFWQSLIHPSDVHISNKNNDKLAQGINLESEYRIMNADGKVIWVHDSAQVIQEENGRLTIYATITDITDRKHKENEIRHLATHDPLTNLPNRIMFKEILEHAIQFAKRNNQKFAVYFLDVDGFKAINDTYGHQIGDELLLSIANRLCSSMREQDTVSRISGDEFTLITEQLRQTVDAKIIAQKIYQILEGEYKLGTNKVNISVSVGGSIFPEHGSDYETLIRKADEAMYQAKNSSGDHFKIYSDQ